MHWFYTERWLGTLAHRRELAGEDNHHADLNPRRD